MESAQRRSSGAIRFVPLLLAALLGAVALLASAGCYPEESCDCSCDEGKVCASSTEGRTGCGGTFIGFLCSPSHCCDYCCDP